MKRGIAAFTAALALLALGTAPTADAARLRGYISKLHVGDLITTTGTARLFIHDATGAFCGVAELSGISEGGPQQVAYETARASLFAQAPGGLQHFTIWWTSSAAGLCTGDVGETNAYFFYHQ